MAQTWQSALSPCVEPTERPEPEHRSPELYTLEQVLARTVDGLYRARITRLEDALRARRALCRHCDEPLPLAGGCLACGGAA